jgi:para-nitrobenzyl esterase
MAAGALCTVLSAMHSQAAPATLLDTLADTPLGKVQGFIQNKTLLFRGIPYAQPPVGAQRWKSTKPPLKWSHVLDATKYAPACAQFGPAWTSLAPPNSQAPCHNNMAGCVNWTWSNATSEDCLYINVYQAAAASPKPRPVVVYFAAGALEWGSGNDLENSGEGLASKPGWKNVILVTLNYRKGVFGFLASDELRARDGATAGAFGLQDQTMALEWVKSNIASFNGDPNRVTLFGESAGATSVSMHMVMPRSRGLFHGAIMDSGAFNQWTYRPWSDAADLYKTLVKQLGCDAWSEPLDCMLSKDTTTLLNISDTYYGNCSLPHKESLVTTQWAPAMDGVVVPGEPVKLLLAGKAADVPVLLGSNKNEGSTFLNHPPRSSHDFSEFFNATFGNTSGPTLAEAYMPPNATAPPPPSPWGPGKHGWGNMAFHNAAQDAAGDFDLRCPTRMAARVFASQGRPTFLYSYDHPPYESVNQGMPIRSSYLGAFHGAEVPSFVLCPTTPSLVL